MRIKNVFNKITLAALLKNRTRTIVTIIGVILSVSMFTAVTTLVVTLTDLAVADIVAEHGNWHVRFYGVDADTRDKVTNDDSVAVSAVITNVGYALIPGGIDNEYKPYLHIAGLCDTALSGEVLPIRLTAGRLPQNSGEVLIPRHLAANGGAQFSVGDTLTLELGQRICAEGNPLGQNMGLRIDGRMSIGTDAGSSSSWTTPADDEYSTDEIFEPLGITMTFVVVGLTDRPNFEPQIAPGFTLITRLNPASTQDGGSNFDVFARFAKPNRSIFDWSAGIVGEDDNWYRWTSGSHGYNSQLLFMLGISEYDDNIDSVLILLAAILIALIMIGSVMLIYNAFAISVSERSRQFGILSSVGATRKQLLRSVLFEGVCIGAVGIPVGILGGLGGVAAVLAFVNHVLPRGFLFRHIEPSISFSPTAIGIAAAIGALTILIAAFIPAKRAVKPSAISIIRQSGDIKIKPRAMKTSRLTQKLFGLEGTLAAKNFKRNKKRYRSTVISLFVSVVLFIGANSFVTYLTASAFEFRYTQPFDLSIVPNLRDSSPKIDTDEMKELFRLFGEVDYVTDSRFVVGLNTMTVLPDTVLSRDFLERRFGSTYYYHESCDSSELEWRAAEGFSDVWLNLLIIDDDSYRAILQELRLPESEFFGRGRYLASGKVSMWYNEVGRRPQLVEVDTFRGNPDEVTMPIFCSESLWQSSRYPPLHEPDAIADDIPWMNLTLRVFPELPGYDIRGQGNTLILVPYSDRGLFEDAGFYGESIASVLLNSRHPDATAAIVTEMLADRGYSAEEDYWLWNGDEQEREIRSIVFIINVFSYGFIAMISLITVANVFNTISTSIALRRRELAMLRSIGMDNRRFNKMMALESLFYGLKALAVSLPVSVGINWLIYSVVAREWDRIGFMFPWQPIAISVFAVFFVVFITTVYSVRKLRSANIIDALREDC